MRLNLRPQPGGGRLRTGRGRYAAAPPRQGAQADAVLRPRPDRPPRRRIVVHLPEDFPDFDLLNATYHAALALSCP